MIDGPWSWLPRAELSIVRELPWVPSPFVLTKRNHRLRPADCYSRLPRSGVNTIQATAFNLDKAVLFFIVVAICWKAKHSWDPVGYIVRRCWLLLLIVFGYFTGQLGRSTGRGRLVRGLYADSWCSESARQQSPLLVHRVKPRQLVALPTNRWQLRNLLGRTFCPAKKQTRYEMMSAS